MQVRSRKVQPYESPRMRGGAERRRTPPWMPGTLGNGILRLLNYTCRANGLPRIRVVRSACGGGRCFTGVALCKTAGSRHLHLGRYVMRRVLRAWTQQDGRDKGRPTPPSTFVDSASLRYPRRVSIASTYNQNNFVPSFNHFNPQQFLTTRSPAECLPPPQATARRCPSHPPD